MIDNNAEAVLNIILSGGKGHKTLPSSLPSQLSRAKQRCPERSTRELILGRDDGEREISIRDVFITNSVLQVSVKAWEQAEQFTRVEMVGFTIKRI